MRLNTLNAIFPLSAPLAAFILGFALATGATPAAARSHHHSTDTTPPAATRTDAGAGFDYYLLSLSWSPTYCLTHAGDKAQCGSGKGYGFVLHGLWPQYSRGGYPADCATSESLTPEAVKFGNTVFPSPKLVQHEWDKHGTCSGLSALAYFQAADQARTRLHLPPELESPASTRTTNVADLIASLTAANPGLPANALAVTCQGPQLAEVRVCVDRNLAPQACGKGVRSSCRDSFRIPASR